MEEHFGDDGLDNLCLLWAEVVDDAVSVDDLRTLTSIRHAIARPPPSVDAASPRPLLWSLASPEPGGLVFWSFPLTDFAAALSDYA